MEVLLLEHSLGSVVIWRNGVHLLESFFDWDTIRERKRLRLLPQQPAERGSIQDIVPVGLAYRAPLVTEHDSAPTWIDHPVAPAWVDEEIVGEAMHVPEALEAWIQVDTALVGVLKVVADVHELSFFERVTEEAYFGVSRAEAREPVIGHKY